MGIFVDEDGWPMIKQSHIDAVAHYLTYMWIKREYYQEKKPKYMKDDAEKEWHWKCGQARGNDELPDRDEMMYLSRVFNQLLPLPSKNFF